MANKKTQQFFLLGLMTFTAIILYFILSPFLIPLALSMIFAVVLFPIYKKILSRVGHSESIASLLTVSVSMIAILIPVTLIGSKIFQDSMNLYTNLSLGQTNQNLILTVVNNIGVTVDRFIPGTQSYFTTLSSNIDLYLKQGLAWLFNHLGVALSSLSSLALSSFIFLISLFYLLKDGRRLKRALMKLSPLNDEEDEIVLSRLEIAVNSVIKGSLLIALIQGVLTGIGFTIFGVPNSATWGALTVLAALVPGIGTSLIIVPGVLYLFIVGNTVSALGLIIWGVVAVGLIDNLLGPKIIGNKLELHPLLVLLSVLGGLTFFGPSGVFLGPLTVSLLFALLTTYEFIADSKTSVERV